jgi:chemotaxis protein MotB
MTIHWPSAATALIAAHVLANLVWIGALLSETFLLGRAPWLADPVQAGFLARRLHTGLAVPAFLVSIAAGSARLYLSLHDYAAMPSMYLKLAFALGVIVLHHMIGARARRVASGTVHAAGGAWLLGLLTVVMSAGAVLFAIAKSGPAVSKAPYDAKAQEAEAARSAQLQQQISDDEQQISQLKASLGMAQSQAITDEQKAELEEARRAVQDAQERGKLLDDLQAKFKKMIDAGHLKVTTRRGRIVLQLHNDVLFAAGQADLKPDGKLALAEIAATLKSVPGKRFQVAGHTDTEPMTTETKKTYPTNWELSSARAIAVVKLLVQEGVDPNMLSAAGYSLYDPVASNASTEGQAKNRRIEITLVPQVTQVVGAADTKRP